MASTIGPDGKVERRDDRPAIMNMKKSLMKELPWPFRVMRLLCDIMSSPGTEPGKARLITIPYSHYNDRARWVLALSGVAFTEDGHPPGFAMFPVQHVTNDTYSATPVIVFPDGEVVVDSGKIVRHLVDKYDTKELKDLYPPQYKEEILNLESEMEVVLGANVRQVAYTHVLDKSYLPTAAKWFAKNSSRIEQFLYDRTKTMLAKGMISLMRCRYSRIPKAEAELDELFKKLGDKLSKDGCNYIAGDGKSFTAADLTFATLAYPLLHPPEMSGLLPPVSELPDAYRKLVLKYRASVAGQHAMRVYREHRFLPGADKNIIPPNTRRNENFYSGLAMVVTFVLSVVLAFLCIISYLVW